MISRHSRIKVVTVRRKSIIMAEEEIIRETRDLDSGVGRSRTQ